VTSFPNLRPHVCATLNAFEHSARMRR
jgi:hypothetical protein